jgi:hypothetical protein
MGNQEETAQTILLASRVCVCTYINTNIHTYIHIYIHTYIHKYIHTYIHIMCVCVIRQGEADETQGCTQGNSAGYPRVCNQARRGANMTPLERHSHVLFPVLAVISKLSHTMDTVERANCACTNRSPMHNSFGDSNDSSHC